MKSLTLAAVLAIAVLLATPVAKTATFYVPDDYTQIQQALDSASSGDTIIVRSGIYFETIDFRGKAVVLQSESGPQSTTINGDSSGSVFLFMNGEDSGSVVDGFKVTGGTGILYQSETAGGAFFCQTSSPCIRNNIIVGNAAQNGSAVACVESAAPSIENNQVNNNIGSGTSVLYADQSSPVITGNEIRFNNGSGIILSNSDNVVITSNDVSQNLHSGIKIIGDEQDPATGHLVSTNTVIGNSKHGIELCYVDDSTFSGNTSSDNLQDQGIFLQYSNGNAVSGNTCNGNKRQGIVLAYSCNNTIEDNTCNSNLDDGMPIWFFSHGNIVRNNTCNDNAVHGIHLNDSDNCLLEGNTYSGNGGGIQVVTSCNNHFVNNVSAGNQYGIHLIDDSFGNTLYRNHFDNSEYNAHDLCGGNDWDNGYPGGGNYWGDYTGVDLYSGPDQNIPGPDGIGDTTHQVPTATSLDRYPLMIPVGTELVLDDSDAAFNIFNGKWTSIDLAGAVNGSGVYASPGAGNKNAAWQFTPSMTPGTFGVYVHVVSHQWLHLMSTAAPYRLYHKSGQSDWIHVDLSDAGTEWVYLGNFCFDTNGGQGVLLTSSLDGYVLADAVKFVYVSP